MITTDQNKVYCIERVKEYLGVMITCTDEEARDIVKRIDKGSKAAKKSNPSPGIVWMWTGRWIEKEEKLNMNAKYWELFWS